MSMASYAGVYASTFTPPPSWTLLGTEIDLGPAGILDAGWRLPRDLVAFDEWKLAGGPMITSSDEPSLRQCGRYIDRGRQLHGAKFLGLRLIYLGAPLRSVWFDADGNPQPLLHSPYWFGEKPD
jgi:hypothetical protein